MPFAVIVLGLAIFAQGTSELMLAGLLPMIASDLAVSVPEAGLLISGFAVGMLVGAPVLAVLTLRLPRRTALGLFLAAFVLAHVAGALAPGYGLLMASRVIAAVVYAGFWAAASVTAIGLVAADRRAKAMAVVAGGLTVAMVVGLPLGTLIGEWLGWRAAFWAVAAATAVVGVAVLATVPGGVADPQDRPHIVAELRTMRDPRLWLAFSTNALTTAATLVIFSYIAPLLIEGTGLPPGAVPAVLALYGLGTVVGITVAGRTADAHPTATLATALGGIAAASLALGLVIGMPVLAVVAVGLLGVASFATNPALNARVFALAGDAPTMAAATNVSAFNLGIIVGPALGGLLIGAGYGYAALTWAGAALALLGLGTVAALGRTGAEVDPTNGTLVR